MTLVGGLASTSPSNINPAMFRPTPSPSSSFLNFRVITYNVLSSHLASPSHFSTLNEEHLKEENRILVVLDKLKAEITEHDKNVVVCLQEVSYDWAGEFHTFFANQGFHMVTGLYGKRFSGYMGVAMAWPTSLFDVVDVDISRLSDRREEGWPRAPERNLLESFWMGVTDMFSSSIKFMGLEKKEEDPPEHWALAERRNNVLLNACLKDKTSGKIFSVGTYHMPCAYYCPMSMTIHAELAIQHVSQIAKIHDAPFVLAGDFNIKPTEAVYELLTTGKIDKSSPFYPSPLHGMEWEPKVPLGVQSAYAAKTGREPDFTNYARIKEDEPFIDTLDYIFLSSDWKVDKVLELPHRDNAAGPFPNLDAKEPSDHLLIAASISLKSE